MQSTSNSPLAVSLLQNLVAESLQHLPSTNHNKLNKLERKSEETTECVKTGRAEYPYAVGEKRQENVKLLSLVQKSNIGTENT